MYTQSPLDLLCNFKRFDKKAHQKAAVVLFSCLSIAVHFIPTILTKVSSTSIFYMDEMTIPLDQALKDEFEWPSSLPVFDNFINDLPTSRTSSLIWSTVDGYIANTLHQNNSASNSEYWFGSSFHNKPYAWDDRQKAYKEGFVAINGEGRTSAATFNAFGLQSGGQTQPSSITLHGCNGALVNSVIDNITTAHGLAVYGVKNYTQVCYPVYDTSLQITANIAPNSTAFSLLSAQDSVYRQVKLTPGGSTSSSIGVSIFNHNSTHMTMGVKTSAHITLYNHNSKIVAPFDCFNYGRRNASNNFINMPHNAVLCDLISIQNNSQVSIVQAEGRKFIDNYAVNMVYTLQRGNPYEAGDSIMIDYTVLQAFTVEGNLPMVKEYLVAQDNTSLRSYEFSKEAFIDPSNDKIGYLLMQLPNANITQENIEFFAGLASIKVRYENGNFSDFNLYQAQVLDGVLTPVWWIITVTTLAVIFLLPQASRLVLRRIPEYSKDLRSLLLLTIERTHVIGESKDVKNVSIVLNGLDKETDQVALLAVNGYPVAVGEKKVDNSDSRLLNEAMDVLEEQLVEKH